jgi:DNA replication protein DnaC
VLDDIGQLAEYKWTKEALFEIVDARYSNALPTLFTANYEVKGKVDSWAHISNIVGSAMVRRIRLMSKGLLLVGKDNGLLESGDANESV